MEPQQPPQTPLSPQFSQAPQPGFTPTVPPAPKKKMSKRTLFIIIGSILVVAILLIAGIKALLGSSKETSEEFDSSIYHMRDGYNFDDYGKTVGDPLALSMDTLDAPFKSSAGPIVYACNILTIKELTAQKAYLDPRSDAKAVTRTYIDGVGKAGVKTSRSTLPTGGTKDNNCSYGLQSGGILSISVYQPPFTAKTAIDDEVSRLYGKTDNIGSLDTYKRAKEDDTMRTYMMVSGDSAIQVLFNGTKVSEGTQKGLLATIAKNFTGQQVTPKGPAIPAYNTPTYKKQYARACDFISNDDIKTLSGSDASVYATEALASATGVAKVGGKLYNSITTKCSRYNTDLGSGLTAGPFDQMLELTITSFSADAPAKLYTSTVLKDAAEKTAMGIGDEAYGYRDSADQNAVIVRQGRFVAEIMFDRAVQANARLQDTAAMVQKLTPYTQQVAAKLQPMQ